MTVLVKIGKIGVKTLQKMQRGWRDVGKLVKNWRDENR